MKRTVFFLFCIVCVCAGCKTDFDIDAPYKEITVVYGLLNTSDTVQWVRINKAYLGKGNALVMAQQPDSINYPDILDVKLEEYSNDVLQRTIQLKRDSGIQKEPGIFATSPNILYRTDTADRINQANEYKLVVYNRETSKFITAQTVVVDSLFITSPSGYPGTTVDLVNDFRVKWSKVDDGDAYQVVIRFHYDEIPLSNLSDTLHKYVDWVFPVLENASEMSIEGNTFFSFIGTQVKPDVSVKRFIKGLDFIFSVGAKEFYTYVLVNHPPSGVEQNIPQYTNVDGGIGIFSSRLNQQIDNVRLNSESIDSLVSGSYTYGLNFF